MIISQPAGEYINDLLFTAGMAADKALVQKLWKIRREGTFIDWEEAEKELHNNILQDKD